MGIFSKKTTITVSTAALHLMESAEDPITEAVIIATIKGEDIVGNVLDSITSGYGVKMRRAYNYAVSDYTLGLPEGNTSQTTPISFSDLETIIATDIDYPYGVVLKNYLNTEMQPILSIISEITLTRNYNSSTNIITVYPEEVATQVATYTALGERIVVNAVDAVLSADRLSVSVTYNLWNIASVIPATELLPKEYTYTESFIIPDPSSVLFDTPCVYATYQKRDNLGVVLTDATYHWIYYLAENTYPDLSGINVPQTNDTFLPVVPIRYYNEDYCSVARQETELYKTSKKLLDKLAMDINGLADKLNENPDIGEIDHAYVMFGVDLQTDNKHSLWYLGSFFEKLYDKQSHDRDSFISSVVDTNTLGTAFNAYISGSGGSTSFNENGLDLTIEHDYITIKNIAGTVGRVGTATKEIDETITVSERTSFVSSRTVASYTLYIKMQVAKNAIKEIAVHGLRTRNSIYRGHGILTGLGDVRNDVDEHNLIIPIEYNLAQSMRLMTRNQLYQDSALMVINTYVKTKQKWYQTSWFKVVLIIVAIIITIYTGQVWVMGLVASGTALTTAIIIVVVSMVVTSVLISAGVKWVVNKYGAKLGVIGAVVLMAIAVVMRRADIALEIAQYTLINAQTVVQIALALISSANEFLVIEGQGIIDEYASFREEMSERWEELKTAQDLFHNDYDINPLEYTSPARLKMMPYEGPDAFIQRTIQLAENTYYTIHDQIPNFYNNILTQYNGVSEELYNQNIRG